jgi:hypothetical protein
MGVSGGDVHCADGNAGVSPDRGIDSEGASLMRTKISALTLLLAAGAGAVAISAAPIAAADTPSCSSIGPNSECQTPGNVQINDSAPVQYVQQYPDFSLFGLGRAGGHR